MPAVPIEEFGDAVGDALVALNRGGSIVYVNSAALKLLGFSREELLGKKPEDVYLSPDYRMSYLECLRRVLNSGKSEVIRVEVLTAGGCTLPAELKICYFKESCCFINIISTIDLKQSLRNLQIEILDMIVKGESVQKIATALCRMIEEVIPESSAALLIYRSGGREIYKRGDIPEELAELLSNPPVTSDINKIPLKDGEALLSPIVSSEREILGFMAVYSKSKRICQFEIDFVDIASKIASIFIYIENKKDKLKEACKNLKSIDDIKSCIIANVRHELLTPVTIICTALDVLEDKLVGEEETVECIRRNLSRLIELVEDLLEVAKLYRGEVYLRFTEFRVGEVIAEAIEKKLEFSKKKGVKILWGGEDFPIYADKLKIKKALVNLLDNAIKFNRPGGRVYVLARKQRGEAVIEVRDTGVGIPQEKVGEIFQPLTQLDFSTGRKYNGAGIGLAVVKRIAELHSGRVEVRSQLGKGSSFYLILPLK